MAMAGPWRLRPSFTTTNSALPIATGAGSARRLEPFQDGSPPRPFDRAIGTARTVKCIHCGHLRGMQRQVENPRSLLGGRLVRRLGGGEVSQIASVLKNVLSPPIQPRKSV